MEALRMAILALRVRALTRIGNKMGWGDTSAQVAELAPRLSDAQVLATLKQKHEKRLWIFRIWAQRG